MHRSPRFPDYLDIIRTVREARVVAGPVCPHCDGCEIILWGAFSGRQRYRCKVCRKTFSDLTRTAFAYSKRISDWPHYLVHLRRSSTLRVVAERLNMHLCTAFRWRHALLRYMEALDCTVLDGTVELKELLFAYSRKGARGLSEPRRRGVRFRGWEWHQVPRDRVLLACSRSGIVHSALIGGGAAAVALVQDWVHSRLRGRCTILSRLPRAGPVGSPVRSAGHDFQMLRSIPGADELGLRHTRNVEAYERRLLEWIATFRGVASKYRDHYLVWHHRIDADYDLAWARTSVFATLRRRTPPDPVGQGMCVDRPP